MAAAVFVSITSGAQAYGDHDDWDCGNSVIVTRWKDQLSFTDRGAKIHQLASGIKYKGAAILKRKGKAALKIKWDFTGDDPKLTAMTANGSFCHFMSDMDWHREWCRKDKDPDSCEQVKAQEEWERNQKVSSGMIRRQKRVKT